MCLLFQVLAAAEGRHLADGGSTAASVLVGDFIARHERLSLGNCAESQPDPSVGCFWEQTCGGGPAGGCAAAKGQRCCWGRSSCSAWLPMGAEQGLAVPFMLSALQRWPRDTEVLSLGWVSRWDRPQCCGGSRSFWVSQLVLDVML